MPRKKKIKGKLCLDVGCGFNKQPGFIGMDKRNVDGVDIVHDVEQLPWPVDSGSVSVLMMSHLLEHIKPWKSIDVINECWRVLEDEGLLLVSAPYAGSFGYYQDPTHCNPINEATPTYFIKGQPLYEVYRPRPWKGEKLTWAINGNIEFALRKINEES